MTINAKQLRELIVEPACRALNYYSPAAVNLLMGTAAQESHIGAWIAQKSIGVNGGLGLWQMESSTYHDVWLRGVEPHIRIKSTIRLYLGYESKPIAIRLVSDLMLACMMSRIHYQLVPEKLPDADDLEGLARYWKKYYNTSLGKGTEEEFIENYKRFLL
jgi:hypothetical protein